MSKNNTTTRVGKPSYSSKVYNLLITLNLSEQGLTIGELGNPAPQTMQKLRAKRLVRIQKIETGKRGRPAYRYFLTADGKRSAQAALKRQEKASGLTAALDAAIAEQTKVAEQETLVA